MTVPMIIADKRVQKLNEIKVPDKFYNRILTGTEMVDLAWGGQELPGLMPGSSTLLTGAPGAGKSTLALQMADMLQTCAGKRVLVNVGEENKYMIKIRGDRLRLNGDFLLTQIEQLDDLIAFCEKEKVDVIVQDSLQVLADGATRGHSLTKTTVRKLQAWKDICGVTSIYVGHVTKGGQFAGPRDIQHTVDVHAHMKTLPSGSKSLEMTKNRFGPASVPYELSMSSSGLSFKLAKDDAPGAAQGQSAASQRRDHLKETAIEALRSGEKLSGYCFERLGLDCSGGFWRGILAMACKTLQDEGNKIREEKIDGRTFFSVG